MRKIPLILYGVYATMCESKIRRMSITESTFAFAV